MANIPKNWFQRTWRNYKGKIEYQSSPFPFPARRKRLFDKLHDDFLAIITIGGIIWIVIQIVFYFW